jgi:lipopolysaccharide biosynthesis glycosyltransferase
MSGYRVFVGWDSREPEAYDVCAYTLRKASSVPLDIVPIRQADLRQAGLYWRDADPLASTEFTYTRFLVPQMAGYEGWALYCDCDFLWTGDVAELFAAGIDDRNAVACVHHDHRPTEASKMDGKVQTSYPRKNWSSLMLFNCGHTSTQQLTADVVNTQTGAYLHRMQWAKDDEIGSVDPTWNWLEGHSPVGPTPPKAIHYTRGGPWMENWRHVQYADRWLEAFAEASAAAEAPVLLTRA